MNEADLRTIEESLAVKLPLNYAQVLLQDPFDGGVQEFYGEVEEILEENLFMRHEGYVEHWPANWLIIGDDGAGDDYFLDLSLPVSPVFFLDHERYRGDEATALERAVSQAAPSLEAYVEQVRANVQEWREFDAKLDGDVE